jgi:predicted small metal-binding protein
MGKMVKCRDIGFDCDAVIHTDTEDEALAQAAAHAQAVHGLEEVTPEVVEAVKAAIRDE